MKQQFVIEAKPADDTNLQSSEIKTSSNDKTFEKKFDLVQTKESAQDQDDEDNFEIFDTK